MKMLDDLILQNNDGELIKNYFDYFEKLDKAYAPGSFIVCSKELAEVLNDITPL